MPEILYGPVPHTEAADFIRNKPAVSRDVFNRLLPEIKARTFVVSGLVPLDVAQKLRDRIADLPAGADWGEIKRDLADTLSPFLAQPKTQNSEPETEEARAAAERKAELLLRTHGYQAYSAAQYNVLERQKDVFPYWRYQTAQDDRVRDSHAALEGIVLPANDPFWQTHFPPWDFNCRCTVVPLSEADYQEIKDEDAKKAPDEKSILAPQQIARMNTDGTLVRGPNVNVDVRAPRQKRDGGDGYAWQPGDLRIPLQTLRERYSPEVFSAFEEFAKKTTIEDGRTIEQWLGGEKAAAAPERPTLNAERPTLKLPESPIARRAPVSNALEVRTRVPGAENIHAAIAMIDRVHDDGALPRIKLGGRPRKGSYGVFTRSLSGGQPPSIEVSPRGPWPRLTTAHEIGHFLDWSALGDAGAMASEAHPEMAAWRAAVEASSAIKRLRAGELDYGTDYFLRIREMWARSYAQYIAHKSGDPEILAELDKIRQAPKIGHLIQWSDDDFKPIASAIDELFKQKGWIA